MRCIDGDAVSPFPIDNMASNDMAYPRTPYKWLQTFSYETHESHIDVAKVGILQHVFNSMEYCE